MRDFYFGGLAGLITGILLIPILKNLDVAIPFAVFLPPIGIALLFGVGMLVGRILGRWLPWMFQFSKFAATGFMNAAIDFGILNLLIFFSGIAAGSGYIAFKALSFLTANINSYVWNHWWVFKKEGAPIPAVTTKEYMQFFTVSVVGIMLNVGAAAFVVTIIGPQWGVGEKGWANIGAAAGSAAGLLWNFLGYKFIVFKA
ncbi:MAG: GtrA family protein [Candidatus Niyogibacteria bacterium]|nr:GtrA family protein [Candidatus Niyogibacteria bacterium]